MSCLSRRRLPYPDLGPFRTEEARPQRQTMTATGPEINLIPTPRQPQNFNSDLRIHHNLSKHRHPSSTTVNSFQSSLSSLEAVAPFHPAPKLSAAAAVSKSPALVVSTSPRQSPGHRIASHCPSSNHVSHVFAALHASVHPSLLVPEWIRPSTRRRLHTTSLQRYMLVPAVIDTNPSSHIISERSLLAILPKSIPP